jgi:cytoskeletal protein CcmA (bactofilin family)
MANQAGLTIGKGIYIKGEVNGAEDLVVEGCIEGSINLKNHLYIAQSGSVLADVQAEAMTIYGEVKGDITSAGRVEINETARVIGDVRAPVVYLADGAKFRGLIEMEVPLPRDF